MTGARKGQALRTLRLAAWAPWLALSTLPWLAGCNDSHAPAMASSSTTADSSGKPQAASPNETKPADGPAATDDSPAAAAAEETAKTQSEASKPAAEARPAAIADITFDDIKFDIQPDEPFKRSMLTEKIEKLGGRPIRIRGFILPSFKQTGLTQFVLVRDNLSCCFGPGAALYDCIVVEMKPGKSTDYSLYPVAVEGTFTIREFKDPSDPDGKVLAIYHLDGESVR